MPAKILRANPDTAGGAAVRPGIPRGACAVHHVEPLRSTRGTDGDLLTLAQVTSSIAVCQGPASTGLPHRESRPTGTVPLSLVARRGGRTGTQVAGAAAAAPPAAPDRAASLIVVSTSVMAAAC